MTIVLNSNTGISTPPVSVLGDTSGSITFAAPAVAGTNTQTLVAATGTLAPLIAGTAQTAPFASPNTYADFTGIPSWVKRITVMFNGVSTSGTAGLQIQLGDSGGFEITGYIGASGTQANSSAFTLNGGSSAAATTYSGSAIISNVSGNIWAQFGVLGRADGVAAPSSAGAKTLSDVLTQVRITTSNGTDTFDAGSINILYE